MPFYLILAILLAILSALFAIQNSEVVDLRFLSWEWEASLALILILTLGVGILIGYLAGLPSIFRGRRTARALRRQLDELEGEARDLEVPAEWQQEDDLTAGLVGRWEGEEGR